MRLNDQRLILAVDSIENIEIAASGNKLIDAKIINSHQSEQIQLLRKKVLTLQKDFDNIGKEQDAVKKAALRDTFQSHLEFHKREVLSLILNNPLSLASYYSLYQQINGSFIFSPFVKEDLNYYRAVATSFQNKMPDYERTKNLYNLVIAAIQEDRKSNQKFDLSQYEVNEISGFVDLELKDRNGYPQKLSSLGGKPILLDFSAYATENSIEHTFELREIYNKYSNQGLQIYQVSIDQNKLYWQQNVSNIPWTAVIDETGKALQFYKIRENPTLFLINKEGEIVGRYEDVHALKKDLSKVL